jgi:Reverse transcriptase (RNA-dependent DNA polymerase)
MKSDKAELIKAMKEEISNHSDNGNWIPVLRSSFPEGTKVIPSVWAMCRKRRLLDGKIHKWKARLNLNGSKQTKGVTFWETYAHVAQWISIRLILYMAAFNRWPIKTLPLFRHFPRHPVRQSCTLIYRGDALLMKTTANGP